MEQGREDPQDAAWAQRAPYRRERNRGATARQRRWPLVAIVCIHLVLIVIAMRIVREDHAPPARDVLEIELIAPPPRSDAVPSPRGVPAVRAAKPIADAAPATATQPHAEPAAPELRLFDDRGALLLPKADADAFERRPARRAQLPERRRALVYEPTRFAKYFVPDHETLGQRLVRKHPLLGIVLAGVNAPHCGTDPDHVPEECDPQRMVPDLNALAHPLDTDRP
jgi:hypothetical protein